MSGESYNLPVTDCEFRRYCDDQRIKNHKSTGIIGKELQQRLNESDLFLRVGLTRIYKGLHWLQISGFVCVSGLYGGDLLKGS
jgi:hypothetical protein